MKTNRWINYPFYLESGSVKTEPFKQFARDFRSDMRSMLKNTNWNLIKFYTEHFYVSGFIQNSETGKFVYFSVSDVRFFKNEWSNNLLYRTAKDINDFSGGVNNYCCFCQFLESLERM